ncbi:protein WEAK CHLOROPLAST MOVEMENT UNDER BLUE LIGHT 1-like [Impatiens glandulifera]|uniref:protein WEAK CHLOROPLAST MOVEMENT UNDER BLUE LIGHT 1-like n=1 Tax=Impatiens glandulifera TaxID=253017 RepID=UPI001FB0F1BD|nr:protein WEAK CHLOROPLAST MOVEMENT UNDER BLUE LIGHT 1-like [Impatiens glandulifera]
MSEETFALPSLSFSSDDNNKNVEHNKGAEALIDQQDKSGPLVEESQRAPPLISAIDTLEPGKEIVSNISTTTSNGFPNSVLQILEEGNATPPPPTTTTGFHDKSHPSISTPTPTTLDESKGADVLKSVQSISHDVKEEKPNNDASSRPPTTSREIIKEVDHARQSSLDERVLAKTLDDPDDRRHNLPSSSSTSNAPHQLKKVVQRAVPNYRGLIDTASPIESVKEAVSKFGGIVDWKAHKVQTVEKRKVIENELEKVQNEIPIYKKQAQDAEEAKDRVSKELESTKRLIEELKLNLEKSQMEEHQAKQDAQLARLRVQEMEQGVADESSVAAKAQLEVAQGRHATAISDLKSVTDELQQLSQDYSLLLTEKDLAIKKSDEALSAAREVEKTVEDLTIQLITSKESLESAHTALLEAEEHRIGTSMAIDQDTLYWEKELNQTDLQLHKLNQQILSARDLNSKLHSASDLLAALKAELSAYMESKINNTHEQAVALAVQKDHLEQVKQNIEKSTTEVNILKLAASSLKAELEKENSTLATIKQREGMASVAVASLEAELKRMRSEIAVIQTKEKEAREKMVELPKMLQESALEADQAKLLAVEAREKMQKAKEEAEQTKAAASTIKSRLLAAEKEIEASRASEKLALAAINALKESEESAQTVKQTNGVTVSLEEYYELSKRAHEAEQQANSRVTNAVSQIEVAKESELQTLRKMEEVNVQLCAQRESLKVALEKAEKSKERKLGVEQELRKWRAEHEERRRKAAGLDNQFSKSSMDEKIEGNSFIHASHPTQRTTSLVKVPASDQSQAETTDDVKVSSTKKKKKSFFPRIFMFLTRKKTSSKT